MTDPTQRVDADARTLVTYAACTNARIAVLETDLLPYERERLQRILDRLTEMGFVTLATVNAQPGRLHGIDGVIGHLRSMFGGRVVDAAVGAAEHPASPIEAPETVIPLTRFEPDRPGDTELTAYGQLFGYDIIFKAVAIGDGNAPINASVPMPRLDSWNPACGDHPVGTVLLPGQTDTYAVFATMRPS